MEQENAAQRPTDDFNQRTLLFTDPLQHDDEVMRPIVLFAENVAARRPASIARLSARRHVAVFKRRCLASLINVRPTPTAM